jgi:diguanylate cyclase (GGDEF)-like protein/PAS domain S-box-containing protein
VLLLGLAAIASINVLQQRGVESRDAQLRLAEVKIALNKLQSAPFDAGTGSGTAPALVLERIESGGREIRKTLAHLRDDSPPRALTESIASVDENLAIVRRVYALIRAGRDPSADRLSAIGDRHAEAARRLFVRASHDYEQRASRSEWHAAVGSGLAIVLLLAAFSVVYRRSSKARLAVERNEERFRTLVANIPGAAYRRAAEPDLSMLFVSDRIKDISGWPAAQFASGERSWASLIDPEHRESVASALGGTGPAGAFTIDYTITHADGSLRWVRDAGRTVRAHDGAILWLDGVISDITDLKRLQRERELLERQLRHDAAHDPLTDLPNRALFEEHAAVALARARRRNRLIAALFLDLDDFKLVNDTLGHAAGDELLQTLADRLRGCLRESDVAARFGGDEFAVLLEDISSPEDACATADRILAAVTQTCVVTDDRRISPSASIGIAVSDGREIDTRTLLHHADLAMYTAKADGKGNYALFIPNRHVPATTVSG